MVHDTAVQIIRHRLLEEMGSPGSSACAVMLGYAPTMPEPFLQFLTRDRDLSPGEAQQILRVAAPRRDFSPELREALEFIAQA